MKSRDTSTIRTVLTLVCVAILSACDQRSGESVQSTAAPRSDAPALSQSAATLDQAPGFDVAQGRHPRAVRLVEVADFQCPGCRVAALAILPPILQHYSAAGDVAVRVVPYAIRQLHPVADVAREAAFCAQAQGVDLAYLDRLFSEQDVWGASRSAIEAQRALRALARPLGINEERFALCQTAPGTREIGTRAQKAVDAIGVRSTPTFFLNGVRITPANGRELAALIDSARVANGFPARPLP